MRFKLLATLALVVLPNFAATAAPLPPPSYIRFGDTEVGSSWVAASASNKGRTLSSSLMTYSFRVEGPADISVPLGVDYFFDFDLSFSGAGSRISAGGVMVIQIGWFGGRQLYYDQAQVSIRSDGQTPFISNMGFGEGSFEVLANTPYTVTLIANANSSGDSGITSLIRTYADPYLAIDTSFAAGNPGYLVSFSPGIENVVTAPVPEASTAVLLLAGLGLLPGIAGRRREAAGSSSSVPVA